MLEEVVAQKDEEINPTERLDKIIEKVDFTRFVLLSASLKMTTNGNLSQFLQDIDQQEDRQILILARIFQTKITSKRELVRFKNKIREFSFFL